MSVGFAYVIMSNLLNKNTLGYKFILTLPTSHI